MSNRFSRPRLQAWLDATGAIVPFPPGEPDTWTCLFDLIGPEPLVAEDDRGITRVCDGDLLRELLGAMGRPCREEEQEALLLTTPIPGGSTLIDALVRALRHSTYSVRQRAALLLGHLGDARVVSSLLANTDDSDDDARRGDGRRLSIHDPRVGTGLQRHFDSHGSAGRARRGVDRHDRRSGRVELDRLGRLLGCARSHDSGRCARGRRHRAAPKLRRGADPSDRGRLPDAVPAPQPRA